MRSTSWSIATKQALRTFLRGITADDDPEDMAQETFPAVWTHARRYAAAKPVSGCYRSPGARPRARSAAGFAGNVAIQYHAYPAPTRDMSAEDQLAVRQAPTMLPLAQRAAIVLSFGCGLTHSEAAEALRVPLGTL